MNTRITDIISLVLCGWLVGCLLEDAPPAGAVRRATLVAIVADPAEALPGEDVRYRSIVATPDGSEDGDDALWSFCTTQRPLSENAAVSVSCATTRERPLMERGASIETVVPMDTCAHFGPETSIGLRPTDPDRTGGYYQPIRVELDGRVAVFRHRVRCALANAPFDVARRFQVEYQRNVAPGVLRMRALDAADALAAGAQVTLVLDVAPDASERYVVYDLSTGTLKERFEALDVRWFASTGQLPSEQTAVVNGRATARWVLPEHSGSASIWAVLRDDRGGVASLTERFEVVQR